MKPRFIAGGEPEDDQPKARERRRYPCLAHGCPMAGAIFLNGHDAPGICALHYGCNASDMPKITEVLRNWGCVTFAHGQVQQFLNDPDKCTDIGAERVLLAAQWGELQRAAPEWPQLKPYVNALADWRRQLLAFLVWRIDCEVGGRYTEWQWPPAPSRTVRDMLSRLTGRLQGPRV